MDGTDCLGSADKTKNTEGSKENKDNAKNIPTWQDKLPILTVLRREVWEALPPLKSQPLKTPVKFVRYTYDDDEFFNKDMKSTDEICSAMRDSQKRYMALGLDDVPYNFLIGKNFALEGRGFDVVPEPQHPSENNYRKDQCLDIAFCGNYSKGEPTVPMLYIAMQLHQYGLNNNHICKDCTIIPLDDQIVNKQIVDQYSC